MSPNNSKRNFQKFVKLHIGNDSITCTVEHPFFENNSWVEAKELKMGDSIFTFSGSMVRIDSVINFKTDTAITVFNFVVPNNHNYFVTNIGILVHNACKTLWGWTSGQLWRTMVNLVKQGNTITKLNGIIPTQNEAELLIHEAGGTIERIQKAHAYPNPHTYPHLNYTTPYGTPGTIQIQGVKK